MNILITGAAGFIGKNLIVALRESGYDSLLLCDKETTKGELSEYTRKCDFVFHLAGINRPKDEDDFMKGNADFTSELINLLAESGNKAPIIGTSSTQVEFDNPYGKSKLAGEKILAEYGKKYAVPIYIFRLTNVFGKWCRPNYNSVVATFCHNIANDLPIQINDENSIVKLVYVDDVTQTFIDVFDKCFVGGAALGAPPYASVPPTHAHIVTPTYEITLGDLSKKLYEFKNHMEKETHVIMNSTMSNLSEFDKKLFETYKSYEANERFYE